ncbi:MAG: DsbA family oxidoreductase [Myxococcota bacterium]|nr:DsbA family oxidoreductase [Myxococcota bacterium]
MKRLALDVWSDIACPWCYVGKRRLEGALAQFAHQGAVDLTWRAFELDPSAPAVLDASASYAERLATKYGSSVREAEGMIERMTEVAAQDGLELRFDRVRAGNTFDAHRALHAAIERGPKVQDAVKERLLRGYMTEGEAIGDRDVVARLAGEAGLERDAVRAMLETDAHAREVRADEARAQALGIRGVPFFVIGGRYGVSGAQPIEVLLGAIEKAWSELPELEVTPDGATCGPDGCA